MLRKLVVVLAVMLPIAAQVAENAAGVTRIDLIVTDSLGNRVRGLDIADFEVTENGERRPILGFDEYSPNARPGPPPTDTMYVPLLPPTTMTPPRRVRFLVADAVGTATAQAFIDKNKRPGDQMTIAEPVATGDLSSRIAAAVIEMAPHPEKKALVVIGEVNDKAESFAKRRGVTLYDMNTLADAPEDLSSYYSLTFRGTNTGAINIRTTRSYTIRATAYTAPLASEDAISDAVLAQHVSPAEANDLDIRLATDTAVRNGSRRNVKLHVFIPVRNLKLLQENNKLTGGFDVYISLGDGQGNFSPVVKQTHAIDWPAEAAAQSATKNIDYAVDVVLGSARSRISVGVVDHRSKKNGYARIEVPE